MYSDGFPNRRIVFFVTGHGVFQHRHSATDAQNDEGCE